MTVVIGLLAVFVSAAAAVVALLQWDIARMKLRSDLFERRAAVFQSYYELMGACMGKAGNLDAEMHAAHKARAQSHFLFPDPSIPAYLKTIDDEVFRIEAQRKLAKDPTAWPSPQERAKAASQIGPDVLALDKQFPEMVKRLSPYLTIDDRPLWLRLTRRDR